MSKTTRPKSGAVKPASRRDELRRNLPRPTPGAWALLQRPGVLSAGPILLGFIALIGVIVLGSRDEIRIAPGRIMTDTRVNRLDFTFVDEERTAEMQREARERAPDVYMLDVDYLETLRSPLYNLPVLAAQETDFESISEASRRRYALDEEALPRLARYADEDGNATATWTTWVDRLLDGALVRRPVLTSADWQRGLDEPQPPQLRGPDGAVAANWRDAITLGEDRAEVRAALAELVELVGFPGEVSGYVAAGLASKAQPTYVKDEEQTAALAEARAAEVGVFEIPNRAGEVIFRRGDRLTDQQLASLRREAEFFRSEAAPAAIWLPRLGIFGLIFVLLLLAGAFLLTAYPRLLRNNLRIVAIGALMTGMLAFTAVVSAQAPQLILPAAVASTLFVAIILLLAYDQRLAVFLAAVQCAVTALALDQGVGWFMLLTAGSGTMVGQLREVRQRGSLIRAAIVTAVVMGTGSILLGLFVTRPVPGMLGQVLVDAAWAAAASLIVGFLVLGILPSIERLFDITTGMTLAELRDPSQPLLRQLQQRAPGTYNHSLQVANIAEAAADAIGADSLLVYVGALYHDIGKMNKPEYFIENQTDGYNKHSKLRPAMSLLVIIGHVKDGIELAREYGLPRPLQHFIESHHGTTLVEYFYHAAKEEAEADEKTAVDEVEFRYPGPRPRTREAALLMLVDAVESATRAMAEPNPSRIESLVRELSRRRLLDGQFDECDLTFRELGLVEDRIIQRLCAIHHGRISYPSTRGEEGAEAAPHAKPA